MSWFAATRARMRLLFARRASEARMDEEIALHIEMETSRLVREHGLSSDEARRQALAAFGGIERYKEELRDGRGLSWLTGMSLDLRLGFRMLVKHPGLTVVGVLGISLGVAIGAVGFGMTYAIFASDLPLDEGDRIVAIESVDPMRGRGDGSRTHLHDLATWRQELTALADLGAYRTVARNLIVPGRHADAVRIAEMTASGFRIARVPPLLGRYLLETDERPGAPPVVVIGHSLWQRRFAGDTNIVGRAVRLGGAQHTVVGVMPPGFRFPVRHEVWTPLRLNPLDYERGEAPDIRVFGRLASTATIVEARTQLSAVADRLRHAYPETHGGIRTLAVPYARSFFDSSHELRRGLHVVQVLITMILVLIATNVAMLVYARTVNRAGELAVRTALGASRGRIVAQLFAEALALSGTAAAVGLVLARFTLAQINAFVERALGARVLGLPVEADRIPYWLTFEISPGLVLYVAGLAVLAAVIVGVAPGLRATRHRVHAGLQHLGMGGSGIRLGKTWTVLIVAQVAAAVAILPVAFHIIQLIAHATAEPAYETSGLLTATLHLDRADAATDELDAAEADAFRRRLAQRRAELVQRLEAEPGVVNVILAGTFPTGQATDRIEIEDAGAVPAPDGEAVSRSPSRRVGISLVGSEYFATFGIRFLSGRPFHTVEVSGSANVAIVEQTFVQEVLGGGPAVGRRVRRVGGTSPGSASVRREAWYEIVGVVADFPPRDNPSGEQRRPRMYLPLLAGEVHPAGLMVRVRSDDAAGFAGRFRDLTVALDPMLRLENVRTLDAAMNEAAAIPRLAFLVVVWVTSSVLLLSAAGIYALVSFTVVRRRREIGIRAALGAGPRRVVANVLYGAAGQMALGIVVGTGLAGLLVRVIGSTSSFMRDLTWLRIGGLLVAVAAVMAAVGLAAALGPARRALRIQPTEALRAE